METYWTDEVKAAEDAIKRAIVSVCAIPDETATFLPAMVLRDLGAALAALKGVT